MRTRAIALATLVLLAGATSALAAAPVGADPGVDSPSAMDASTPFAAQNEGDDEQNATELSYENLTVQQLNFTDLTVQQVVLNQTNLQQDVTEQRDQFGTATATDLTIVNGSFENVTFHDITVRNDTLAEQLFGGETPPDGENATVESASLDGLLVESLVVNSSYVDSAQVGDVNASFAPAGGDAAEVEGEPTVAVENMTVGYALLDSVEAGSVSAENATIGLGVLGGGLGEETTVAGGNEGDDEADNATDGETEALREPVR